MNPFDFVPIVPDKKPQRCSPYGHNKFQGKSGTIECTITTLKPFFIPLPMDDNERQKRGLRVSMRSTTGELQYHDKHLLNCVNGIPVIPGSSLKGVIRSVAEATANSCVTFFENDRGVSYKTYSSKKFGVGNVQSRFTLPNDFCPCTDLNNLCISCRVFGFQSSGESFLGKISISDAKARDGYQDLDWITLTELSGPKPHRKAFYALSSDPDKIAGRKFYFHHKLDAPILPSAKETHRNSTVKPIENATFDFKVTFTNLTDDEYALLLYSLFLEDGVCHKIGYGKPAGLGSVEIKPLKITLLDMQKRYQGFAVDDGDEKSDAEVSEYIKEQTENYRQGNSANLQALRNIWGWPGIHNIRYPGLDWLQKYSTTPISKTP